MLGIQLKFFNHSMILTVFRAFSIPVSGRFHKTSNKQLRVKIKEDYFSDIKEFSFKKD